VAAIEILLAWGGNSFIVAFRAWGGSLPLYTCAIKLENAADRGPNFRGAN
jgi:hypothetical protein